MKILGLDSGAKRCGYAIIEDEEPTKLRGSGIIQFDRAEDEPFQEYRLRLIKFWASETKYLLNSFQPDIIISETIPAVSATNFALAGQSYLAHAQITTVHALAYAKGFKVEQMSASTAKKAIAGRGDASKAKVRDAVLELMPSIEYKRQEWKARKTWDESDAICIALAWSLKNKASIKKGKNGRKAGKAQN